VNDKIKCENAQPKDDSEYPAHCRSCGEAISWVECGQCGGEGGHDGYEEDPLWYQPGEISPYRMCNRAGGWWYHGEPEECDE
jgi:predicted amidophosphoribosyltransferase